ncbi:MAG: YciI family protein [Hyphomonadaceae bacterium]|nr:YciI family protein [Hyphomonadaceae bacterium]
MPLFIFYCLDQPGAQELRLANRPAHLDWARSHGDAVRMAGPMLAEDGESFVGSIFIIEAETLEAARAMQAEDPYVKAGLFERVDIRQIKWVLGEGPRD